MVIIFSAAIVAAVIVVAVVVAAALCFFRSKRYKSTQAQDAQAVGPRPVSGATPPAIEPSTRGTCAVFPSQQNATLDTILLKNG